MSIDHYLYAIFKKQKRHFMPNYLFLSSNKNFHMTALKLPLHLAPLQGYTEAAYRNAHSTAFGGINTYYTPFVRFEKEGFRNKDVRDILPANNQVERLVPQLLANDLSKAESILDLFIEHGYHEVDINLGCPFPMIAKRHNGSGILPYPDEVKDLLHIVEKHPDIDFTVKMRLGWDQPSDCLVLAPILNDLPLKHIAMHPRLGKQQYKGEVDMNGFADFAEQCQHPLIYNGDIETLDDIERIQRLFPTLSGIMIGRGLLTNPALALEYNQEEKLSNDEFLKRLRELHKGIFEQYEKQIEGGEAQLLNKLKTFWEYLQPTIGKKNWKHINKSKSIDGYWKEVNQIELT